MPMTGRQIRLSAIPSKVQLFPWVHATEVVSAVPETTELDSLLGRVCLHRWPFQSRPHAATAPSWSDPSQVRKPMPGCRWPKCKMPLGHLYRRTPLLLLCRSGHFSPTACSSNSTVGLSFPTYPHVSLYEKKHLHLLGGMTQTRIFIGGF